MVAQMIVLSQLNSFVNMFIHASLLHLLTGNCVPVVKLKGCLVPPGSRSEKGEATREARGAQQLKGCLGTSGFVASIGGKRREEPRSPATERRNFSFNSKTSMNYFLVRTPESVQVVHIRARAKIR